MIREVVRTFVRRCRRTSYELPGDAGSLVVRRGRPSGRPWANLKVRPYVLGVLVLAGCGPSAPKVRYLPERIVSVAVPTFSNQTVVPGLEEKLTTRTIEEYLRDGRVRVVAESQADAVLKGVVTKYSLEPLSYQASGANAGAVSEYSLRIRVDLTLRERAGGQDLWTVRDLEEETRYGTESGFVSTEDQARARVLEYLARAAVKQTFEGTYTRK